MTTDEARAKFSKIGKSNSRSGKVFERRVKKLLTEWSGEEFRRRRVEGRGDDVAVVEGVADIIPVQGDILFAIEAKKEKDFSIDGLLANPTTNHKFTKWWHQNCYDAQLLTEKVGEPRYPLLFFKPKPNWDWVAVPIDAFEKRILKPKPGVELPKDWAMYSDVWFPHIQFDAFHYLGGVTKDISHSAKNPVMKTINLHPCIFCRWKDFAANVDPKSIFVENLE